MTILWTDSTAAQATGGRSHGSWQATGVSIDSRQITKGDLFVAITGENFDGHHFVADALANGAVAAVVSQIPDGLEAAGLLEVDDPLEALGALGKAARSRCKAKVVGVTGSVGKTSTKEMLRLALSAHGQVYATKGNLNNHIGTPLNLANLPADIDFAVFEMGMSSAGEIAHLTDMVQPHIAVITAVDMAHMEFFASLDDVARAKCEIFEGLQTDGIAVLNADSEQFVLMRELAEKQGATVVTFGANKEATYRLSDYQVMDVGVQVDAMIHGKPLQYTMKALGEHWAVTSLLTLAVIDMLGLELAKTAQLLSDFDELPGRGSVATLALQEGEILLVDDSYNASPVAMRAAFAKTNEIWQQHGKTGRKIAALGDMLELGKEASEYHAALAENLVVNGFDVVYTAGELMQSLHDVLPSIIKSEHVAQAKDLLPLLTSDLQAGDILLVKGSHGSKMYELAETLRDGITLQEVAS